MSKDKRITEIEDQAAELTRKFLALLKDRKLTKEQDKTALSAYEGLLFWQRTGLELMVKEFEFEETDK